ncbi:hypothetical protein CRUP_019682, partial [Coryphaenoides rupestris]
MSQTHLASQDSSCPPGIRMWTETRDYPALASAVVQVFTADRNAGWTKWSCGVACLVTFEQELYNNYQHQHVEALLYSRFPGKQCQVGLNFANEEEAKRFRAVVTDLMGTERQRKS